MKKSANSSVLTKKKPLEKLEKRVLSANDIAELKKIIEDNIKEILSFYENNLKEISNGLANENNISGNAFAFGSETENIHTSVMLAEHANRALRGNLNALKRIINEETYGLCPICVANNHKDKNDWEKIKNNPNNYIPYQRLRVYPTAKLCIEHEKK